MPVTEFMIVGKLFMMVCGTVLVPRKALPPTDIKGLNIVQGIICSLAENTQFLYRYSKALGQILGDPEVTANMCCNFAYLYWDGCIIFSIYLRQLLSHPVPSLMMIGN